MHSFGPSLAFMIRIACLLAIALVGEMRPGWAQDQQLANDEAQAAAARAAAVPQWIWGATADGGSRWRFTRSFEESQAISSARLRLAADFCRATVLVNGQAVLRVDPYCPIQDVDVTASLLRGANTLEVQVERFPGPVAIAVSLDWKSLAGDTRSLVSDRQWRAVPYGPDATEHAGTAGAAASELGSVPAEQWGIGRRGIGLAADDNYEQWQQTLGPQAAGQRPKIWTVPGFDVSLVRVAQPDEGSWISMAFDDRGRLTLSREDRGLLRLTLDDQRTLVTRVEQIDVDLQECRGLLYADGRLFANANNSKALFRLKIAADGAAQDVDRVREFPGGVGHGRNDLALSGTALLSIHGDSVETPGTPFVDLTSPLREPRRGKPGREGYLVRTDLEGRAWEIVAAGLRNPYGIAVHPTGDPFTFDADNEFDMGTPWYRPTRIVHLVDGGDTGYREAGGVWPPRFHDQPDNTPPVLDIGRSSPTSVMFGGSLAFPPVYRRALFALDWTYGRVLAIHLSPRGAGWRANAELFLQGRPLNVTDLAAGPDGAMYLITGGRKTQSALYRVSAADRGGSPPVHGRHEEDAERFSESQRARRAQLQALARRLDARDIDAAIGFLADHDPLVRHAARVALERLPLVAWRDKVLSTPSGAAALYGLLALARAVRPEDVGPVLERLEQTRLAELPAGQRLAWLRICQLCLEADANATRGRRASLVMALETAWNTDGRARREIAVEGSSDEVRRRIALLLAEFDASSLPALAAHELLANDMQEDRLLGLLALRNQRSGWTPTLRQQQFRALQDASHWVGGQGMPGFLDKIRAESMATLSDAEKTSLADVLQPVAAVDEPLPPPRSPVKQWTLPDLASLGAVDAPRGDATRGGQVFREALCGRCHRVGVRGPAVGPDLTFVARRFSRADMLESIVAPSRSVAENYRNVHVVTEQGQTHVGRIVSEGDYRSQKLKLNTDPLRPGQIMEFDKREIAEYRVSETSPMPQGLLDTFSLDAIRDLLAFLESGDRGAR